MDVADQFIRKTGMGCGCRVVCGDLPEAEDREGVVCKGLPEFVAAPVLRIVNEEEGRDA